jgi:glycosyltransferase involved in cell wall biosynthesis
MKHLSVVIPVHNEAHSLPTLYQELTAALQGDYELLFVDDGSRDNSFAILQELAKKDKRVRIIKLLSNYGQSTALAAGIEHAQGENIVTMDSDLQHDPQDINILLEPLSKGYHVVCGWRKHRGDSDSFLKKTIPSRIANSMINSITGLRLHDTTGGMRAFKKDVVKVVPLYGEMHRYLPVLAKWKGFKITERPIHIRKRKAGRTHYNFTRIFRGFIDLMTVKFFVSYSTRPFHIFAKIGFTSFMAGVAIGIFYLFQKIVYGVHLMQEVASLILSVMLIVLGINFICFGFIADMISFDAISNKKRDMYVVEKIVGK